MLFCESGMFDNLLPKESWSAILIYKILDIPQCFDVNILYFNCIEPMV